MADFVRATDRGNQISPGGFEFGIQGFQYGPARPYTITFFRDNTAMVADQYGIPIKGVHDLKNNTFVFFATTPPEENNLGELHARPKVKAPNPNGTGHMEVPLATHREVIDALAKERYDWQDIEYAGWPQLAIEEIKKLRRLPVLPIESEGDLKKIKDKNLRKYFRGVFSAYKELQAAQDEE